MSHRTCLRPSRSRPGSRARSSRLRRSDCPQGTRSGRPRPGIDPRRDRRSRRCCHCIAAPRGHRPAGSPRRAGPWCCDRHTRRARSQALRSTARKLDASFGCGNCPTAVVGTRDRTCLSSSHRALWLAEPGSHATSATRIDSTMFPAHRMPLETAPVRTCIRHAHAVLQLAARARASHSDATVYGTLAAWIAVTIAPGYSA
jgi:hypothetical protein